MKRQFQFAGLLMGFAMCGALAMPCAAQRDRFATQQRQERKQDRPQPKQQRQEHQRENTNRPPRNADRPPAGANRPADRVPPAERPRPGNEAGTRNGPRENLAPRQQPRGAAQGQWVQSMRSLSPAQRERYFQNSPAFRNLPPEKQSNIRQQFSRWDRMTPQQRADQLDRERVWRNLTPQQKDHIRNDVLPAWRQMPSDRRQAIEQRLRVLQNMPESARNQRLNDPSFTKGMSEEDKAMLHDLSHMHIGSAPEEPQSELSPPTIDTRQSTIPSKNG